MATGQKWTDIGQGWAIDQLDPNTAVAGGSITYTGGWGASNQTPAVTDTDLISANPESRTTITSGNVTQQTTQSTGDTIRWVYIITATGSRTVQETAVFKAAGANAIIRIVHGSLTLESGDQVTYTINLQLTDVSGT